MSPEPRASRSGISCDPPTNRRSCAPLAVSELRAKVPTWRSLPEQATYQSDVEERELVGVGAEAGLGPAADQVLDAVGVDGVAADPLAERQGVPLRCARGCAHGASTGISAAYWSMRVQQVGRVGEDQRVGRHRALVLLPAGRRGDVDALAVDVLVERRHAQLLGEPPDVALGGADEGAAGLDHPAGPQVVVEHPAADATAGLDDEHRATRGAATLRAATRPEIPPPTTTTSTWSRQGALQAGGRRRGGERSGAEAGQREPGAAEEGTAGQVRIRHTGTTPVRLIG